MAQLINTASVSGQYDSIPVNDVTQAIVELSAVSIEKRADKQIWVNGSLNYTIIARNIDERPPLDPEAPGLPVENMTVTDIIDPTIATLAEDSLVVIVGTEPVIPPPYTYEEKTGLLTVTLGTIPAGEAVTITFRVDQV